MNLKQNKLQKYYKYKNLRLIIMVCLLKWAEKGIKNYKWYDVSLLKATVFFFTLFLLTVWDGFRDFVLGYEWYSEQFGYIKFTNSPTHTTTIQ